MNFEKYYKYARKIAGEQGEDLFHHCYLLIHGKKITHLDSYIYTTMLNEWRNPTSTFNKQHKQSQEIEIKETESSKYDAIQLMTILLKLENEGHKMEVKVFKECTLNGSCRKFAAKTGIDVRTINKICNFVKTKIKEEYELSNT